VKPTWAPKLSPDKIKKLYEQDAKGIYDDELVDDVGYGLYARCDSMIMVTAVNVGHPLCFVCRTEIPYSYDKAFVCVCPKCGWTITSGEYGASFKNQTLNGFGCLPELQDYVAKFPLAKTYADKMRLIDALIHAFHGNLGAEPSRPIASNVIEGNIGQIAQLIFHLAYGEDSTVSQQELQNWLDKFNRSISRNIDPATGLLKEGKEYVYDGIGKKGKQT